MNSLDKRVRKIESIVETVENQPNLVLKLKQKQAIKKNLLMQELTSKYSEYLEQQSLSGDIDMNLIEVLYYTIKYVERNKINIGRLLEIKITDDSFDDVVCHLININVPDVNEVFITQGIKFLNSLEMKQDEIVEVLQSKPKKQWFFKKNVDE